MKFEDKSIRLGFMRKVYSILSIQVMKALKRRIQHTDYIYLTIVLIKCKKIFHSSLRLQSPSLSTSCFSSLFTTIAQLAWAMSHQLTQTLRTQIWMLSVIKGNYVAKEIRKRTFFSFRAFVRENIWLMWASLGVTLFVMFPMVCVRTLRV